MAPVVPGPWLVWASALLWAWADGFRHVGWPTLLLMAALAALARKVAACTRCSQLARSRTQTVFGVGNPHSRLVFCGEAPGADAGGNFSADPCYCTDPQAAGDVSLRADSPCAAGNHPGLAGCALIGAGRVACEAQALVPRSWSAVKRLYRP